jgi:hypothetical protein
MKQWALASRNYIIKPAIGSLMRVEEIADYYNAHSGYRY